MKKDVVRQYVLFRNQLLKEKASLEARLADINRALGSDGKVEVSSGGRTTSTRARRRRRIKNSISLKEAVLKATRQGPLSKSEILKAIEKLGYRFAAKNPMNSLSVLLYSDAAFKNHGGKFGPRR